MPISRAIGPLTTSSGAAMCVVACTPLRLKAGAASANSAARTTGAYSALQPAITRLIASTSRVRPPWRGGTRHSTKSGSPPSAATAASTASGVGGTTGSPSVQPCSKYHSTRSVPGTRVVAASRRPLGAAPSTSGSRGPTSGWARTGGANCPSDRARLADASRARSRRAPIRSPGRRRRGRRRRGRPTPGAGSAIRLNTASPPPLMLRA